MDKMLQSEHFLMLNRKTMGRVVIRRDIQLIVSNEKKH